MNFKAWFVAGRHFALPWILFNALFAVVLAGFSLPAFLYSFGIAYLTLVAGHYVNDFRDFEKGLDKVEGGSVAKGYTGASTVIPTGALSVKAAKLSAVGFLLAGFALLVLRAITAGISIETAVLYAFGVFISLTYTDLFKPHGLPDLAIALGHGAAVTLFSYSMIAPINMTAVTAAIVLGLFGATLAVIDQYPDAKSSAVEKAKGTVALLINSKMNPSEYLYFSASGIYITQAAFTILGFLPKGTLLSTLLLVLLVPAGLTIDADFKKGTMMFLVVMLLYPIMMTVGLFL